MKYCQLLLFTFLFVCPLAAGAQEVAEDCYARFWAEGQDAFAARNYYVARSKFQAARICPDLPKDQAKEVEKWIDRAEKELTKDIGNLFARLDSLEQALEDTDQDGVFALADEEPDTPPQVRVDTKGRTLDSDQDGVPDYLDLEPFRTPRPGEQVNSDGVVMNPMGGGALTREEAEELIAEAAAKYAMNQAGSGPSAVPVFPMVYFAVNSSTIRYADYGALASIAQMMKDDPSLRLAVTGFTDTSASADYNARLSYRRADAVIHHLMKEYGISRARFVLLWEGESSLLVPDGASYLNRRVSFRLAQPEDVEMYPP